MTLGPTNCSNKMNKEQLEREYNETIEELEEITFECKRLERKCKSLSSLITSFQNYESGSYNNFLIENILEHFLNSDSVTLDSKLYCRQKVFVRVFNEYCKNNHFLLPKWNSQFYTDTFNNFNLTVLKNARKKYPNTPGSGTYTETFIMGVDIIEDFYDIEAGCDTEANESDSEKTN